MTTNAPNRIAELRRAKGMTQQALAEAVGAHWITISKLERGKLPLSFDWAERLGAVLDVGDFGVFKQDFGKQQIYADGAILDGGAAYYFKNDKGDEDFERYDVSISLQKKGHTNWFVIDSNTTFPHLQEGDLIQTEFVDDSEIDATCLNRLCLVHLKELQPKGPIAILGYLVRGVKDRSYDLNVLGSAPIRNIDIDVVAFVRMAIFGSLSRLEISDHADADAED